MSGISARTAGAAAVASAVKSGVASAVVTNRFKMDKASVQGGYHPEKWGLFKPIPNPTLP
ncbi:hypothetical protein JCM19379_07630 [Methyloparacoccus murrellii]